MSLFFPSKKVASSPSAKSLPPDRHSIKNSTNDNGVLTAGEFRHKVMPRLIREVGRKDANLVESVFHEAQDHRGIKSNEIDEGMETLNDNAPYNKLTSKKLKKIDDTLRDYV